MPTITLTPVTLNSSITFTPAADQGVDTAPPFARVKRDYRDFASLKTAFATFALLKASS